MKYLPRIAQNLLERILKQFPCCIVTGSRQSGKSTMLKKFLPNYTYVTLDDYEVRKFANDDPKLFLEHYPEPVIIDEVQYAPKLFSYIKIAIDRDRSKKGRFVLTGSQALHMMKNVSESLAGRTGIFTLYPFVWDELSQSAPPLDQLLAGIHRGFFPEICTQNISDPELWFQGYLTSYTERDVRDLRAVGDLQQFRLFIKLLAARVGQTLVLSNIANDAGISVNTAKNWIAILEGTYLIYLLRPFCNNHTKRLVKSPKLYFTDTGLLCYLLGLSSGEQLMKSVHMGPIFENMVVMETVKHLSYQTSAFEYFFYRTQHQVEVDLIVQNKGKLQAFEIKFTKTPNYHMAKYLKTFRSEYPEAETHLLCMTTEEVPFPHMPNITAKHWSNISKILIG